MAGITSTGFIKKTLAEVRSEWEAAFRLAFGNSINLRAPSKMATVIGIAAEREALLWDLAEACWNARSPSTAQGVSLTNVGEITGSEPLAATKSKILDQYLFGDAGTLVDTTTVFSVDGNPLATFKPEAAVTLIAGTDAVQKLAFSAVPDTGVFKVVMPDAQATANINFDALASAVQAAIRLLTGWEDVTVSGDFTVGFTITFAGLAGKRPWDLVSTSGNTLTNTGGGVTITPSDTTVGVAQGVAKMIATEYGPTVAQAGTLTVIDTPVTGLDRTTNVSDAELGRNVETDAEFRIRRADELSKSGASTVEAIRTRLKAVTDVEEVIVFQNTSNVADGDGRPPKSVQIFVDGGDEDDIAEEIWKSVAGGIETYGVISKTVVDSQGLSQTVEFTRPVEKQVYIILDVTKDAALFPVDGESQLKANAVTFGDLLKIGEDVLVYPKLLPAIVDEIDGITDIAIKIGFAAAPTLDDNLSVAVNERAAFDTARIEVNFV